MPAPRPRTPPSTLQPAQPQRPGPASGDTHPLRVSLPRRLLSSCVPVILASPSWLSADRPASQDTSDGQLERSSMAKRVIHHIRHHVGVGIICAVAYFDPGNWSTDLLAGSQFGYKLLFIVLLAGLGAVVLQALSNKLGCVTGLDLASHCRLLLHDHPRYPKLMRLVFLYPLYALSELAIISTDLAELLGSAIGLVLLFPKLPLPVAVALTATDVIFILAIGDPSKGRGRPVRVFEFIIIILVMVVFVCFIVLIVKVSPNWPTVFDGYLPSSTLTEPSALYAAVGIIGATVMPHALYLGSHLATLDRVSPQPAVAPLEFPNSTPSPAPLTRHAFAKKAIKILFLTRRVGRGEDGKPDSWTPHNERENNTLAFINAHYKHGLWDIILSLLGFAVVINSAILVLAGAVFFYGTGALTGSSAGLFDAHDLIQTLIGKPAAIIFAIALVCSGQSASITATLAGQIVSEGFIQWTVSPFLRRLLTRLLGLIPAMVVAIVVGRQGINTLLVISQVVLSIVLPFVMFPLIWLTSSSVVMRVRRKPELSRVEHIAMKKREACNNDEKEGEASSRRAGASDEYSGNTSERFEEEDSQVTKVEVDADAVQDLEDPSVSEKTTEKRDSFTVAAVQLESAHLAGKEEIEYIDYSNSWTMTIVAYAIWLIIIVANGYVIVTLAIA